MFNVTGYAKGAPTPPPPPPRKGWGPEQHCESCLPHDSPLKIVGKGLSLAACEEACETDPRCNYINYAVNTDQACYTFANCSKPWNGKGSVTCTGDDWWTLLAFDRKHGGGYSGLGTGGRPVTAQEQADPPVLGISGGQQTGQQGSRRIGDSADRSVIEIAGGQQTGQQGNSHRPIELVDGVPARNIGSMSSVPAGSASGNNFFVENIKEECVPIARCFLMFCPRAALTSRGCVACCWRSGSMHPASSM